MSARSYGPGSHDPVGPYDTRDDVDPLEHLAICVKCWNGEHGACDWAGCECTHDAVLNARLARARKAGAL